MGFEWLSIELSLNDFHVAELFLVSANWCFVCIELLLNDFCVGDLSCFNIPSTVLGFTNWGFVCRRTVREISQ